MKKIVFITGTLSSGGAERVISVLANNLTQSYSVEIVCVKKTEIFYSLNPQIIVSILPSAAKSDSILRKALWFRRYIKSFDQPLIISFMAQIYFFTKLSLLGYKTKIITSERIDPRSSKKVFKFLRKILYPFADALIVQTKNIYEYFPTYIQKKTTIIENPISPKFSNGSALNHPKKKQIISIGRLTIQKNHLLLIRAFKNVLPKYPNYKLKIFGHGPLKTEIESYIAKNSLQETIELAGVSNSLEKELNESEVFVLSSNFEGMSNALIEAMYIGLPVISTKTSGSTDLIESNRNGILIDLNDQKQLEMSLIKLLSNKEFALSLARNATLIKDKVDEEIVIERWEKIITKYLR